MEIVVYFGAVVTALFLIATLITFALARYCAMVDRTAFTGFQIFFGGGGGCEHLVNTVPPIETHLVTV